MYRKYGLKDGQRLKHTDASVDCGSIFSFICGLLLGAMIAFSL